MSEFFSQSRDDFKRHMNSLKWKAEIEERLRVWLSNHPQDALYPGEQCCLPAAPAERKPNMTIKVLPATPDGGWSVWLNGVIKESFYGLLAHQEATKYAADLANGKILPKDDDIQY